jgi:signal transduction histidine kinase
MPLDQAWTLSRTGHSDRALEIAAAVNRDAAAAADEALECRSATDLAWYCLQVGKAGEGVPYALRALELAVRLRDRKAEAQARTLKAWLLTELGRMEAAIEDAIPALRLAETLGDPETLSLALNVVGIVFWLCRQPDRAIEFCTRSVRLARQIGDPIVIALWLINLGGAEAELAYIARDRGDGAIFDRAMQAALVLTEEAERLAAANGDPWTLRLCLGNLAEYRVARGEYAEAKALLDRYATIVGGDYKRSQEHYLYTLGQTLAHLGRLDEAREALLQAVAVAAITGNIDATVHAARHLADVYERQGEHAQALHWHRRFHDAYVKLSADRAQQQARLAAVRYEMEKLRHVADTESRRAREMTDLAESLRVARVAAEQASLAKSRFLAGTSHELRTPLNAIIGFSDTMRLGIFGAVSPPRYAEYVEVIHNSARHLLSLIDDLLDLSKIEEGKWELEIRQVETAALVEAVRGVMAPAVDQHGVTLAFGATTTVPAIRADERALRQILLNLISNAIKFTPQGGRVTVTFEQPPDGGGIDLVVRDTGIGLTEEEIEVAMEPYGQVRPSTLAEEKGTGLGLPLVKALAELHGGTLQISSRKGEGTTAIVRLP